ncbi:hypothetical protein FHG87_016880 [Trinorchestia longiramus]|nr:hypothetical protein FHG87_016880 [Trinorchestia longiramus]
MYKLVIGTSTATPELEGEMMRGSVSCGLSPVVYVLLLWLWAREAAQSGTKGYKLYFNAKKVLLGRDVVFNESQFMSFEKELSKEIECVPWSFPQEEKHEDSERELELRRSTRNRAAPDRFGGWV